MVRIVTSAQLACARVRVRCPGMSTFKKLISGRNVHIYSDNAGAEHATRRGMAKAFDHSCLVHGIWCPVLVRVLLVSQRTLFRIRLYAMQLQSGLWVSRVASRENISDDPSRESYEILERMKAKRMEPKLSKLFIKPRTWESISKFLLLRGSHANQGAAVPGPSV